MNHLLTCSICGIGNDTDAKYCIECGTDLKIAPSICSKCSKPMILNAKFCNKCGAERELNSKDVVDIEKNLFKYKNTVISTCPQCGYDGKLGFLKPPSPHHNFILINTITFFISLKTGVWSPFILIFTLYAVVSYCSKIEIECPNCLKTSFIKSITTR